MLNVFWNVAFEHPLLPSLQATFTVLSFFVHAVEAPVIVPHVGAVLSTYTFTPHATEFPAPSVNVIFAVFVVDEYVCDLAPHPLPPESLQATVTVLFPFVHAVDAPLIVPHVGAFLSMYTFTGQFVVKPALSFIVIFPVLAVALNVAWNSALEHPDPESLHLALIVLFPFVHVVEAPVIAPQVGAVLST